jgi:HAD superfamily hydrolase (TIGR01509 family)
MIKGIVFDMDGLMFDTERLAVEGYAHAGVLTGFYMPPDIIKRCIGLNSENMARLIKEHFPEGFDYPTVRQIMVDYSTDYIEKNGVPLKAGLSELLNYLKHNRYQVTMATSTYRDRAEYYLSKAGIRAYFGEIVCGDMIRNGKPEPDIYLRASRVLSLPPGDCLALEDAPAGILSAHRAGLKPVMIPDLVQPDAQTKSLLCAELSSLTEVIGLLKKEE